MERILHAFQLMGNLRAEDDSISILDLGIEDIDRNSIEAEVLLFELPDYASRHPSLRS